MKVSVLDYGVIDNEKTPQEALLETRCLAQVADKLRFHRFWVAEHHNIYAFATSSPELLMMHLADHTKQIRIGSGGIMPLHYSSFKIAEWMMTLEALHPNRIDLGIGNSLGTPLVQRALSSIHIKEDYGRVIEELSTYLSPDDPNPLPIAVNPKGKVYPQLWLLSNSSETAQLAGQLGLGYTFGIFPYMPKDPIREAQEVSACYRQTFKPSSHFKNPQLMLAAFIVLADTDEEAEALAKPLDIWMLGQQDFNAFKTYPTAKEASHYSLTENQRKTVAANRSRMVIGSPQTVKKQLDRLMQACQADELLAIPLIPEFANRQRALELLADLYMTI
ncbi:UNVERIFIED_CONTAM: LLM class flavin-dependent oxidoreductase [Streptococcus canis]|uniref:Luciferase-like monooxygenase n=1 Tax=Streptococcus canis FSL Z3-227 TaxID=482234 RepID=A0AAV3FRZ0_STRCB|nr:LLM class flavin-dependent oxidoreductase [Streptococcus canis]EIQ81882.1 luciferase-like monooxygenase [Streptococcus canis FSL Z3-227]MDV5988568.1 LLM class flavin-dependent oxidoreductase [Streptococcus canis]MDV5993308.1 LLM class flavin-dependent oxidoreductase [Streptococcus canis]MDV6001460.1 LLM class flavin-dependent oxidoreductase [Streptococcus canis]MDV6021862.1 LLM class flavin-dependent oxidoreductase [Streptococcus canis]